MSEHKKRKLRSSDAPDSRSANLFNFDNPNKLLYLNEPLRIDRKHSACKENLYQFYKDASKMPVGLRDHSEIKWHELDLPRRRTLEDPLKDEVYSVFHRRMKKEEKSHTVEDRNRIYFEMDNLKSQLALLRQHDWQKHLPAITVINDRSDVAELSRKRRLTIAEIEKILSKFANWEARCAGLTMQLKRLDSSRIGHISLDNLTEEEDEDDDESILSRPVERVAHERRAKRANRYGVPVKICLRNGFNIELNPFRSPKAAVVPSDSEIERL